MNAAPRARDADLIATEEIQRRVADPDISAWVEANAGAGKTTVLTNRVIRLLLNGARPENILCITFTKAAAAEMKERLFARLGKWALMPDRALAMELAALDPALIDPELIDPELTDPELINPRSSSLSGAAAPAVSNFALSGSALPGPAFLSRARKLFAKALETPGGLKIQTIHSFCESVLRRFPLEANISPSFKVMEENQARELYQSIIDAHVAKITRLSPAQPHPSSMPPSPPRLDAPSVCPPASPSDVASASISASPSPSHISTEFRRLLDMMGKTQMLQCLDTLIAHRTDILQAIRVAGGREAYMAQLRQAGYIPVSSTIDDLKQTYKDEFHPEEIKNLISILRAAGGNRAQERADIFEQMTLKKDPDQLFKLARATFLKKDGTPYGKGYLYTNKLDKTSPGVSDKLIALQKKFSDIFKKAITLRDLDITENILNCAIEVIETYQARKQQRGFLDFSDLVTYTADLCTSTSADWVLYKLDTGLDHILLDEAQDTSGAQWEVVMAPLREFFSGEGQTGKNRTAFVVGDEKQSIYSFQGADVNLFRHYKDIIYTIGSAEKPILSETIDISFRSAEPILRFVDTTFNALDKADEALQDTTLLKHRVFKKGAAGLVEIWPLIETDQKTDTRPWDAPVDALSEQSATTILARDLTEKIKSLLSTGFLEAENRPVTAADILVLFRRRGAIFHELLKHLITAGIPISGADRLKIKDNILVNDMISVANFILQPDDNLSLAVFLKSPFIGFSEDELYDLAYNREGSLWTCLQNRADEKSIHAAAFLREIRRIAMLEGPLAFFTYLLDYTGMGSSEAGQTGASALGGQNSSSWARGKARLGEVITDPVTEFLNEALNYEGREARSLQGFVRYFLSLETTIKRDLDTTDRAVRLMTVHGAKGLQAPIVILADAGLKMTKNAPRLQPLPDPRLDYKLPYPGYFLYNDKRAKNDPDWGEAVSPLSEATTKLSKKAEEDEAKRLLYVAATRAEYQLYITGCAQKGAPLCWHALASHGFDILEKGGCIKNLNAEENASPAGTRHLSSAQSSPPLTTQTAQTSASQSASPLPPSHASRPHSSDPENGSYPPGAKSALEDQSQPHCQPGWAAEGASDRIESSASGGGGGCLWQQSPSWLHEKAPTEKKIKLLTPSNMLGEHYSRVEEQHLKAMSDGKSTEQHDVGALIAPDPTGERLHPFPRFAEHPADKISDKNTDTELRAAESSPGVSPLLRGIMLHKLLEILPALKEGERLNVAREVVVSCHPDMPSSMRESWVSEVMRVLEAPAFREVFSPQGRAEVSLRGNLTFKGHTYPVSGQIDRLIVTERKVLIVDYKTNRPPPAVAENVPALYLEQLAIYRALIGAIYPEKEVTCALLWTYVAHLMPISRERLDIAYQRFCEKISGQITTNL